MKKDEAKKLILQEWKKWPSENEKYSPTLFCVKFYLYLQKERPQLLAFRTSGDKQQDICSWVGDWQSRFPRELS